MTRKCLHSFIISVSLNYDGALVVSASKCTRRKLLYFSHFSMIIIFGSKICFCPPVTCSAAPDSYNRNLFLSNSKQQAQVNIPRTLDVQGGPSCFFEVEQEKIFAKLTQKGQWIRGHDKNTIMFSKETFSVAQYGISFKIGCDFGVWKWDIFPETGRLCHRTTIT